MQPGMGIEYVMRSGPRRTTHAGRKGDGFVAIKSLLKLPVVGYDSEEDFLKDMDAMVEIAKGQPGFISVQIWKSHTDSDPLVYLVESEWEQKVYMAQMEHQADHEKIMDKYPLAKTVEHLRLVPWGS